jgi:hypothetical protein
MYQELETAMILRCQTVVVREDGTTQIFATIAENTQSFKFKDEKDN